MAAAAPVALLIALAAIFHASSAAADNVLDAERRVEQGIRAVTDRYISGADLEAAALQPPAADSVLVVARGEIISSVGSLSTIPELLPVGELATMQLANGDRFVGYRSPPEPPDEVVIVLGEPAPGARAVLWNNLLGYLALGLLVLVAASALVGSAVKRALRRVESLREQVSGITVDRAVRPVEVPPGNDELTRLGQTLNAMVDRIGRSAAVLEGFAGDTAHELRNPLAAIRANLDAARRSPSADGRDAAIGRAIAEVERSARLVDSLLVVATLERDRDNSAAESCSVAAVVIGVVESAEESHPTISFDTTDISNLTAAIDSTHLGLALGNLVDNAGRHAESTVRISASIGERGSGAVAELTVEDDGPGIPPGSRASIFERFETGDDGRHFGLGLPLARRLVERVGGSVAAIEPSELGGARFVAQLPLTAEATEAAVSIGAR